MNLASLDLYVSHHGNASVPIIGSVYATFPHVFDSSRNPLIPNPALELQDEQLSPSSPRNSHSCFGSVISPSYSVLEPLLITVKHRRRLSEMSGMNSTFMRSVRDFTGNTASQRNRVIKLLLFSLRRETLLKCNCTVYESY